MNKLRILLISSFTFVVKFLTNFWTWISWEKSSNTWFMFPNTMNLLISLLPQLLRIMRHLRLPKRIPLPHLFLVLLFQSRCGCPLVVIMKLRNLRNMSPTHLLISLSLQWRKLQNGSGILQRRLTPPSHKKMSPFITQVPNLIFISFILYHLQAMAPYTMTRLINPLHQLVVHILLILKLLAQIAIKCKEVTLQRQRSGKVRTLSIFPLCFKIVRIKTMSFYSLTILNLLIVEHPVQSILSINPQPWVIIISIIITPCLYAMKNAQEHHVIFRFPMEILI